MLARNFFCYLDLWFKMSLLDLKINFCAEVKQEFDDNCSVQVYSVQVCIPKDPATIWNAEFMQAEELFKQPSAVDNCLRDNR